MSINIMKPIFFLVLLFPFVMASPLSPFYKRVMSGCHGKIPCQVDCGLGICDITTCTFGGPKTICDGICSYLSTQSLDFECIFRCGPTCTYACPTCTNTGFGTFSCTGGCK
ncbi:hypothetical protein RhiirC2_853382 [Rhizophagus irregularis]|uniref:Uncharacterized protein n=1 Tax=Rhizophagus irregularis TaxID=588596 RepID=A0A2N1MVS0_9GLOM|nr:hypothetical protein RhiirC2_853382 [Rhizophagus irregularis]